MKWWGPAGLFACAVIVWFGFDRFLQPMPLGSSDQLHISTAGAFPFVAVVFLAKAGDLAGASLVAADRSRFGVA
ncbi:MAG: hypothetical protein H8E30_14870 [Alphaproteobacteria bacterium]|nr:hypothetical protein [Alphaproteobacteria bacterium]